MSTKELYRDRDYSHEILTRPLPKLDPPEHIFPEQQHQQHQQHYHSQPPPPPPPPIRSPSTVLQTPEYTPEIKQQLWKTNVNSAISGMLLS